MKAIHYEDFGGPEVLTLVERDDPHPGAGQVRVRVATSGVNPVDVKVRQGILPHIPVTFPVVPGWDLAGVVDAVGEGVESLAVGDRVLGTTMGTSVVRGTAAELVVVNADEVTLKPDTIGWEEAAALPLAGLTASQAIRAAEVTASDVVLIHGASGGVGHLATQLAVATGARVIGVASAAKHDLLRSLGAEPVLRGPETVAAVRAAAPHGVDVVLDLVGAPDTSTADGVGAAGVRLVSIGQPEVIDRGGSYVSVHPETAELSRLVALVERGDLRVIVTTVLPLRDASEAHRMVEARTGGTKVVLRIGEV